MFDFENLDVYLKAEKLNLKVINFLKHSTVDSVLRDQFKRAVISICLNVAEGSGKFSKADKRNFYTTARGSVYECVAIIRILKEVGSITETDYKDYYLEFETISKMLFKLIESQR